MNGSAGGSGSAARFANPSDVAVDAAGNVFVADTANHTVRKVTPAGAVTVFAGNAGVSGSNDGSSTASFNRPAGVAVDTVGNVYVADTNNNEVRKVTAAGVVSTLAGQAGITGSADGTGTGASFNGPSGIVADATGNLYVADTLNHTIRKVTAAGAVTTIEGVAGTSGFVDATGSAVRFHGPQGLALDASGNLFVADTNNNAIRKIVIPSGAVTTVAGQAGTAGSTDGANSQAQFHFPSGVAVDPTGNIYVSDTDNQTLREIAPSGAVSTVAGLAGVSGSTDGVGTAAHFAFPTGVAADSSGSVYFADTNNDTIRLAFTPAAPSIMQQPQNQTVTAGANVTFSVTATGKLAPTYQWYFGGAMISGATSSTLALTNVQSANAGNYTVAVTNSTRSVTSNPATLTVNPVNTPPSSDGGSSGSGGGGGAPSVWFCGALSLLALAARRRRRP
jgi:MYXO-CTERM domain-containing protein